MFSTYITRNGKEANITGVAEYRSFNEDHILLSGTVEDTEVHWDKYGRVRLNQVLGIKDVNDLDLVAWIEEDRADGKYYFEAKGKVS